MKKKSTALLVSLVLLLTVSVGATLAFLITSSGPIENIFTPSKVTTSVVETLDGQVKKDVMIKNTGDTTAYIRAAVIVTWQNEAGEVYGQVPVKGTDYTNWEPGTGWIAGADGFYYWTSPVQSDDEAPDNCCTGVLISTIEPIGTAPVDGYFLNVEILGSGIQSVPTSVVTTEWESGVSGVSGTALTIKTAGGAGA